MDVPQPQSLMEVTFPPPVEYETTLHYSEATWLDTIEKVAAFVSEIYAQFPNMSSENVEKLRKAGVWFFPSQKTASASECEKFKKSLKQKIISHLQKENHILLLTNYNPENILSEIVGSSFSKNHAIDLLFPFRTRTQIQLNKEKRELFLAMNFRNLVL